MYKIGSAIGDVWTIVNDRGEVVFMGTKQQCEDWLDHEDNLRIAAERHPGWLRRMWNRLWRKPISGEQGHPPQTAIPSVPPRLAS